MKQVKVGIEVGKIPRLKAEAAMAGVSLSAWIANRALGRKAKPLVYINVPVMTKLAHVGNHLNAACELLQSGADRAQVAKAIEAAAHALGAAAIPPEAE